MTDLRKLMATMLALGLAMAVSPAVAQDDAEPQAAEEAAAVQEAEEDAGASGVSPPPEGMDEVVVTATKRRERLRDVPISMTVMSGEELRATGAEDLTQLTKQTANVRVDSDVGESNIRGLGELAGTLTDSSVALVIDGVYYGRNSYMWNAFLDIDRFEVMRGPQGTIFGKNASAGVIAFTLGSPEYEWGGHLRGTYGEYDQKQGEAMITGPIWGDTLAFRLAASTQSIGPSMYNTTLDRETNIVDGWNARGKLTWDVTDFFNATLMFETYERTLNLDLLQLTKMSQNAQIVFPIFDPDVEDNEYDRRVSLNSPGYRDRIGSTWNLHLRWEFDDFVLQSVGGYSVSTDDALIDADMGPAPLFELQLDEDWTQISEELRITGEVWRMDYVLGAYYLYYEMDYLTYLPVGDGALEDICTVGPLSGLSLDPTFCALGDSTLFPDGSGTRSDYVIEGTTYAGFGQVWTKITDNLKLITGLRYTTEEKTNIGTITTEPLLTYIALGLTSARTDTDNTKVLNGKIEESRWSSTIAVNYEFNDAMSFYASRATAFKAGGFNNTADEEHDFTYEPEDSISYEAGMKGRWFNGMMQLNVGLYRTEFENMQVQVFTGSPLTGGEGVVASNAAAAVVQGVELDGRIMPLPRLMISGSLAYNDSFYEEYRDAPCPAESETNRCDLTGEELAKAPLWNGAVTVGYRHPLGNWPVMAGFRANATYASDHYLTIDLDPYDFQEAAWQYNAAIGLFGVDNNWRLVVQGLNLGDEQLKRFARDVPLFAGSHAAYMDFPRRFSVTFGVEF